MVLYLVMCLAGPLILHWFQEAIEQLHSHHRQFNSLNFGELDLDLCSALSTWRVTLRSHKYPVQSEIGMVKKHVEGNI